MAQYNYSRDQLIALLRRGLSVYKNDEVFVKEIVNIASYLIEIKERDGRENETSKKTTESASKLERVWIRENNPPGTSSVEQSVKKYAGQTASEKPHKCKLCGAEVVKQIVCPRCNGISK